MYDLKGNDVYGTTGCKQMNGIKEQWLIYRRKFGQRKTRTGKQMTKTSGPEISIHQRLAGLELERQTRSERTSRRSSSS